MTNIFQNREMNQTAQILIDDSPESAGPVAYYKHMHFINFEDYGRINPIYVNLVRDPVERVISWYYYIRSAAYMADTSGTCEEILKIFGKGFSGNPKAKLFSALKSRGTSSDF